MHSPLPDSSNLEAGILEDERPSRLSRVHDNVRNLLRASIPNSVRQSIISTPPARRTTAEDAYRSPQQSPRNPHARVVIEVLPSPSSATATNISQSNERHDVPGVLFPPTSYHQQGQHVPSTMFNTRAIAALTHPDLSDPSLAIFLQQKTDDRQRRAWKRSRNRKLRHGRSERRKWSWVFCVAAGLTLAAMVAIYLAIATSSEDVPTKFHVIFILGILGATIVFAHTLVRLCLFKPAVLDSPGVYMIPNGRLKRRRHHRHHHREEEAQAQQQDQPQLDMVADFVPPTPIAVHVGADEVRPDSREAEPSAGAERASRLIFDKDVDELAKPPPAYGRWRGSVRVNPDFLHWQAIPSPTEPNTPALPSPTYEEAMATEQRSQPPSYMTRDSPERRREMQDGRPDLAQAQVVEPEMVEGRGIGLAS
ncbi:hypothetical protein LTR10_010815 [Elasticomyces elasticus]|nr:hypothetical protein LTR10_010815 [Elasticomyces elasticus]KAK4968421.1 hypothetical protein LTR42_009704 [Elasticomyces elasticus]